MMRNSIIFLGTIVAILFLFSCKKDNGPKIAFKGVTEMDKFGAIMGNPDTTDWKSNDRWIEKEKSLFSESFASNCADSTKYRMMFYPNPCRSKSTLYVIKDSAVRVSFRLVDKNFNVIMSQDSVYASTLSMDLSSFTNDDTIRIYYKFITPEKCEYKGHGDIFVHPYK